MTTYSTITDLNSLNSTLDNIVAQNIFVQIDSHISYLVNKNDISSIRDYVTSFQDLSVDTSIDDLHKYAELKAASLNEIIPSYHSSTLMYIFPNSVTKFKREALSSLLPSFAIILYDYLKSNNRIVQIGSGYGQAILLAANPFHDQDFTALRNLLDISSVSQAVNNLLLAQSKDIEFLLQKISDLENILSELTNQNQQLINTNLNIRLSTWA